MSLQLDAIRAQALRTMEKIQADAERARQAFTNSFNAVISDLAAFEQTLADPAFGPDDLAFVNAAKTQVVTDSIAQLGSMLATLQGL